MATRSSSALIPDMATDARFQAACQFIEDTLVATGGWVVTADTGQTLPSAILHPTATNTKMGYRVYRMNDALQSSAPVFMRVDFGSAGTATYLGLWITIGGGSNLTGGITNVYWNGGASIAPNVAAGNSSPTQITNSYGSADTNRATIALFVQSVNSNFTVVFCIERSKNTSGADTSDGVMLCYTSVADQGLARSRYVILTVGAQPNEENGLSYVFSASNPQQTFGGNVGIGVLNLFKGIAVQPGYNVAMMGAADMGAESQFTMSMYGNTHTYQHLNSCYAKQRLTGSVVADTSSRVAIRYD